MKTENAATLRKPRDQPGFFLYGIRQACALLAHPYTAICAHYMHSHKCWNTHCLVINMLPTLQLSWHRFSSNLQHQLGITKIRVSPFVSLVAITAAPLGWQQVGGLMAGLDTKHSHKASCWPLALCWVSISQWQETGTKTDRKTHLPPCWQYMYWRHN